MPRLKIALEQTYNESKPVAFIEPTLKGFCLTREYEGDSYWTSDPTYLNDILDALHEAAWFVLGRDD